MRGDLDLQDEADLSHIPVAETSALRVVLGLTAGAIIGVLVAKLLLWVLIT